MQLVHATPNLGTAVLSMTEMTMRSGLETDLLIVGDIFPNANAVLGRIFDESVRETFATVLDESTVSALLIFIGNDNMRDPHLVFATLDNLLGPGAPIMVQNIAKEFSLRVHRLVKRSGPQSATVEVSPETPDITTLPELPTFSYSATLSIGFRRPAPSFNPGSGDEAVSSSEVDALLASFNHQIQQPQSE